MNITPYLKKAAVLLVLFAPTIVAAATVVGGSSPNGGFFGVSGGSGSFGISWGNGAGVGCASNICSIASTILYTINFVLVPLLFAIAFIVFLYGVFKKYIWSHGDPNEVAEGHRLILWGVVGFVIMLSLWGLVNIVANTFGLAGASAPTPPSSIPSGF